MKVNIAGADLYHHIFSTANLRNTFEDSVAWDLEGVAKMKSCFARLGAMADGDELDLLEGDSDFQTNLLGLYKTQSELREYLCDINLYCRGKTSNSYVANFLLEKFGGEETQGVWVRPELKLMVFNGLSSDGFDDVVDLRGELDASMLDLLNRLFEALRALATERDEALERIDRSISRARQEYSIGLMLDRISVNYDVLDELRSEHSQGQVELTAIRPLPTALDFHDLRKDPMKYLSDSTKINISEDPLVVTLIVEQDDIIYQGFTDANILGLGEQHKSALKKRATEVFASQIIARESMSGNEREQLIAENLNLLSQNFSRGYRVIASGDAVIVTPYGGGQDEISRMVALKLLELVKEKFPDTYLAINQKCQAISAMGPRVDPRVALAICYEFDARIDTVFSDYPISAEVRGSIAAFESLMAGMRVDKHFDEALQRC